MHVFDFVNNHQFWFSLISQNHKTVSSEFLGEKKSRTKELLFLVGFINLKDSGFHERTNEQQFCGWLFEFFKFLKNND